MQLPQVEHRITTGNLIAAAAGMLTLIVVLGSAISQANSVPQIAQSTNANTASIAELRASTKQMQINREDDLRENQQLRVELIGRMDRIENKLDSKADKDTQARGWTR
jgi:C4-dicarboxylate-specific signal transduction histidine kinase